MRLTRIARQIAASRAAPWVVAALGFLTFSGTLGHGFVYDDGKQIVENPWIWNAAEWTNLLSRPVWAFADENATNFYRPVQTLVHFMAARISGRSPWAFHLLAVAIHALASASAFLMLRRLTGPARALLAACLFAVHPIHAEAVAWVSAGPDPEAAASIFMSLAFLAAAHESSRPASRVMAAGVAALPGFFAKETALVTPVLAWLMPARGGAARRALLTVAALAPPMALYLAARALALGGLRPDGSRIGMDVTTAAGTALALVPRYLALAFWPWSIVPDRVVDPVASPLAPAALAGAGVLLAAALVWFVLRRRSPVGAWGIAWLIVPLLPALMISWFASTPQADRYLYIPALGACIVIAEALGAVSRRAGRDAVTLGLVAACALLVVLGAVRAMGAAAIWRDSETLGRAGISLEPRSFAMRAELIHALDVSGRPGEALTEARAAAALVPGDPRAAAAVASLEARAAMKSGGDAVAIYRQAAEANPGQAHLWVGLSAALLEAGRPADAIEAAERALAIDRFNRPALVNLGTARGATGDLDGQERESRRLLAIDRESPEGWLNLGGALLGKGSIEAAREALLRAASLDPASAKAELYLSWAESRRGDRPEALRHARRATELDPRDAEAWNRLGVESAATGDHAAARAAWQTALSVNPNHAGATENLRRLQQASGSGGP